MKMSVVFDFETTAVSLRSACDMRRACRPNHGVAHLAFELGLRNERGDGVDDDDVDGGRPHERLGDLERLFARVGLGDHEVVHVDAELPGVVGVHRVLGVDEGREPAALLRLGDDVKGQGRLARGLRPEDFDDAAAGDAADSQRGVHADGAGRDGLDDLVRLVAETDEGALPELPFDLLERLLECFLLFLVHFDHLVSLEKRGGL